MDHLLLLRYQKSGGGFLKRFTVNAVVLMGKNRLISGLLCSESILLYYDHNIGNSPILIKFDNSNSNREESKYCRGFPKTGMQDYRC